MISIFKYQLPSSAVSVAPVLMPPGARILSVANQSERLVLWAAVDYDQPMVEVRRFMIVGTGHEHASLPEKYIGTAIFDDGRYVLHVFELPS